MNIFKSVFAIFLLAFTANVFSEDSFEFNPQIHSAQIENGHIWFQDNSSSPNQIGPELYADDTNADFFNFIKNSINDAVTNNSTIILLFSTKDSQNHEQYDCIMPES